MSQPKKLSGQDANKLAWLAILLGLLFAACTLPTPRATTPARTPGSTAEPISTPVVPTNTASAVALDWPDLAPFRQAMRPAFVTDVDEFADATRYSIDLRVDLPTASFTGTERVRYTNHEATSLSEVVFRLLANTPGYGGSTTVPKVEVNGVAVEPDLRFGNSALYVPLASPLLPGEHVELSLSFQGTLPTTDESGYAQYGYFDGVLALPNVYPMIPVYDDEGWNVELAPPYGDATFTDTSLYLVRVTLPADMILAASGTIVEAHDNGDGTVTHTCASGPMRDFNIVASADYETLSARVGEVLITSYYLPDDRAGGERALDYASQALGFYEELLGAYPFIELDVMATPTLAGGIEYPGLIVIAAQLYDRVGGFFEMATVHETAHQWWYSLVGNDQIDEPWLDEALTQYTSLLYFEHRYGQDSAQQVLESVFLGPYQRLRESEQDMPAGLPVAAYPEDLYGAVVYGKGPLFFHELRKLVGEGSFEELLRAYLSQYRYAVAYPSDFVALAERVSQQDLDPLYKQWILGD